MDGKLDAMWKTYDTINEQIKFADTKATALLALNGIVLTFIFSLFNKDSLLPKEHLISIILLLGLIAGLISILFCAQCINPTLSMSHPQSLFFFGNICKKFKYPHDYERIIRNELDKNLQLTQITNQVWIISKIACKKYAAVINAAYFFAAMVVSIGILEIVMILSLLYQ